ncbi:hypothetical protein GGX14DRAFT_199531 [Mycena pura]|uniref:DUF6533 domain-containing protein n=1 Tax=Mycena pura TaxID=153505 RepID=A0AAD6UZH2_9AGAR|nr:hypothetical protein GGX14DRAFT_199531 [Mycena pura]
MSFISLSGDPNFVQGSATGALTWVVYDVCLTWNRELSSIWRAPWTVSKVLFLFSRYHTVLALGFFLMEAIGTKHFKLPLNVSGPILMNPAFLAKCTANLPVSNGSRWYLGLTEVLSIMSGEFMILIRINAVYGWSRSIVALTMFLFFAESVVGLTTTIRSIRGGAKGLLDSTDILTCKPDQANIPDVNFSSGCTSMVVVCIYLILIVHKARDVIHVIDDAEGQPTRHKLGLLAAFKTTKMTPALHVCLRDAALYFLVIFCVLLVNLALILSHDLYAQMGTAWLLATYSVASTRIFLNLKDLTPNGRYNESSWSKFQENSALEFNQVQSAARTVAEDEEQPTDPPEAHVRTRGPGQGYDR